MTSLSAANSTTEDRSILGPKKFAAMLQTVATSFDDESGSWSMDNTATSFDALSFDVIQEEDDADDVSGDAIGDNVLTRRDEVFAAGNDGSSATADASQSDEHQETLKETRKSASRTQTSKRISTRMTMILWSSRAEKTSTLFSVYSLVF